MNTKTKFSIRDILSLTTIVAVGCGWAAQSFSWRAQRNALLVSHLRLKTEMLREKHENAIALAGVNELQRQAERRADNSNEDRMKMVKEMAELKKQLGLKNPPAGTPDGVRAIFEANHILAAENKHLKDEVEKLSQQLKAQVAGPSVE